MIANFFQSLDRNGVEYLLISGQATVLYGAATFSEDIDLWINPTEPNRDRFLLALQDCHAQFYKLTPPATVENLRRGHGFHFILPDDAVFLDVMGRPPRAGSFAEAAATACRIETEWGAIQTIGIQPLVELKKTQRLEDYPIISKLAIAWFGQPGCAGTDADFNWALQNIFTLPELARFFTEHPAAASVAGKAGKKSHLDVAKYARQLLAGSEPEEAVERRLSGWFQSQISELQQSDRQHWRNIIRELKELRAAGKLMPEGKLVSPAI
jgi:hypothetical protein